MSNKKQTAVEFAVEKLAKFIPSGNQLVIRIILEQAKELEKQQIEYAYIEGAGGSVYAYSEFSEEYYNETFKK